MKHIKQILLVAVLAFVLVGCDMENTLDSISTGLNELENVVNNNESKGNEDNHSKTNNTETSNNLDSTDDTSADNIEDIITFEGYTLIEVDGGDLSGHREPNVVVDIGFGSREYYAFTNEYGQLVRVIAAVIVVQDENSEPVTSAGRYFPDEAKVPGTESKYLDEGHVLADSLGGVANAYNITPQESTLNRHGEQAYLETVIRNALYDGGTCTDLEAIITYPNTETQIPSHYSFTYTLNGTVINDEFDNVNPEEANEEQEEVVIEDEVKEVIGNASNVSILQLDKNAEFIILKNNSEVSIDITGWKIISVRGNQEFIFSQYVLQPNTTVKVGDIEKNPDVDFHWLDGRGTWNNSDSDPAELYDSNGTIIDRYDD